MGNTNTVSVLFFLFLRSTDLGQWDATVCHNCLLGRESLAIKRELKTVANHVFMLKSEFLIVLVGAHGFTGSHWKLDWKPDWCRESPASGKTLTWSLPPLAEMSDKHIQSGNQRGDFFPPKI